MIERSRQLIGIFGGFVGEQPVFLVEYLDLYFLFHFYPLLKMGIIISIIPHFVRFEKR